MYNLPLKNINHQKSIVSRKALDPNHALKVGIWVYFFLLLFEGALRKWVVPALSTPLLIIRDPIALWLLISAARKGLLAFNIYTSGMIFIAFAGVFTAVMVGHGSFPVAVYGARILALHFPLIFVIGRVFNRDDVVKLGKMTLLIAIPMTILIALQFYSPQSAWVNRSIGGGLEGGGFSGAMGYLRPPATFSFINGTTSFYGFLACFVFYFWLNTNGVNKIILLGATFGLMCAIPLSISRTLLFEVGISLIFAVMAISRKPQYLGKMFGIAIIAIVVLAVLSQASFFQTATAAFTDRFTGANEYEGGVKGVVGNRYLGGMIQSVTGSANQPFWGLGLGIGTSVGGSLLLNKAGLQLGEDEWQRLIGELGIVMGLAAIFLRVGLCLKMFKIAYRKLVLGDLLPWMLLSFGILNVAQGQWGQPTSLGFGVIIGGLTLASFTKSKITAPLPTNKSLPKTNKFRQPGSKQIIPNNNL